MLGYGQPLALGPQLRRGRGIAGREQVVIITHRMWQERFGGDPGIIGRAIRIDGRPHAVVGVLGAGPADHHRRSSGCRSRSRPSRSTAARAGCT